MENNSVMKRPHVVDMIRNVLHNNMPDVKGILYGSEARGDAKEDSDIDLLLLVDKESITLEDQMELTGYFYEIELQTGIQINPFIESLKNWGKRFTPFYENVTKEGILL